MTDNKSLFSTYKAYDGGNVVFGSNLKGKIIGKDLKAYKGAGEGKFGVGLCKVWAGKVVWVVRAVAIKAGLKALEDNFLELRQTNQYAEALSSIPGIVDHYLANKMQEAVDVAVQLKNEESNQGTSQTTDVFEAPAHQEFETGVHDEQAEEEVQHLPDWFQQPTRRPSPNHAWNKSVPVVHESVQPWLSNLARRQDP
ncbi:hypothetical protein Tco_0542865 [Tanacetum coccineum]